MIGHTCLPPHQAMLLPLTLGILLLGVLGQPPSTARHPGPSSLSPGRVSKVFQPFSMHEVIWLVLAFHVIFLLLLLVYSRVLYISPNLAPPGLLLLSSAPALYLLLQVLLPQVLAGLSGLKHRPQLAGWLMADRLNRKTNRKVGRSRR